MTGLDEEVGRGRWLMALSGDHGALEIPEYLAETGGTARRGTSEELATLRALFQGHRGLEGDPEMVADSLISKLEALPFIADALSVSQLTTPPPPDSFAVLLRNSFHSERWNVGYESQGSGVVFRFAEGYYPYPSSRGTGHGSPYYYDRHVPMVFFGRGVSRGESNEPVRTVDIAPTLAELAGIPFPSDLDGQPLLK